MNNICSLESPLSAPCLPGFQCILQEKSSPPICSSCRLGEFCPKGTINPSLSLANSICPEGNYCSTPANITVCPSGHFCPSGSVNPTACAMKGLYCEEGIASPSICPAGFYCPTSDQQILCPKGNFCKKFSIFPAACPALALCPEGSQYPGMKGRGILIFLGFSVLLCGLYWYIYAHFRRKQKNGMKVLLSRLDDYNLINAMFRSITGHAYDIYTFKGLIPKASKATIGFEKLSLTLKDGCSVLDGVTGEFKNSSLCAIMGPSGAGKSTFLNALTGKATYGEVRGNVFINGKAARISDYRSQVGFVPQDDIVFPNLTVRENLLFNALLRLPRNIPTQQKLEIVVDVIKILGLSRIQNSIVGNVESRGISGGQRKRVNIGMELVAYPDILFLDEPTSGLDSTASLDIISSLKDYSRLGVMIVAVIHQPRYSLFKQFDSVLLLGLGGRTVYLGATSSALDYFENIGFKCQPLENPADFFLDVISGSVPRSNQPNFKPQDLFDIWEKKNLLNIHKYESSCDSSSLKRYNGIRSLLPWKEKLSAPESNIPASEFKVFVQEEKPESGTQKAIPIELQRFSDFSTVTDLSTNSFDEKNRLSSGNSSVDKSGKCSQISEIDRNSVRELALQEDDMDFNSLGMLPVHFELLREAFIRFDTNNNGVLDANEFRKMLVGFGFEISEEEANNLMSALDFDNDGEISLKELNNKLELVRTKIIRKNLRKTVIYENLKLEKRKSIHFFKTLSLLTHRALLQFSREGLLLLSDILIVSIYALLIGLVYSDNWDITDFPFIALLSTLGYSTIACTASVRVFGSERLNFWREASVGINTFAYFVSKNIVGFLPLSCYPFAFAIIFFNLIAPEFNFWILYIISLLLFWSNSGLGILLSLTLSPKQASLASVMAPLVIGGFFSGVFPFWSSMSKFLKAVCAVSHTRWASNALIIAEYRGLEEHVPRDGILFQGFPIDDNTFRNCHIALFLLGLGYRFLAYVALFFLNRNKRK